jgi:hypothetical protein
MLRAFDARHGLGLGVEFGVSVRVDERRKRR